MTAPIISVTSFWQEAMVRIVSGGRFAAESKSPMTKVGAGMLLHSGVVAFLSAQMT